MLASAACDGAPLVWDVTGRILSANQKITPLSAKELDAAWSDLSGADAAKAWQAICGLIVRPEQAVPFLKQRLPANLPLDKKLLAELFAKLDHDDFEVREQASKDLVALSIAAIPAIRKLQDSTKSPEVRMRAEKLLAKIIEGGIQTLELRCGRALEVLEFAATPEAIKLLETEAKGAAESVLTQGAKAALDRLAKRQHAKP